MTADAVREATSTPLTGLPEGEVARRLAHDGRNVLPRGKPVRWWRVFLRQFRNPLIYVLGLAALLSLATARLGDAGFIVGVLFLNAAIGSLQEWRAERSAQALQQLIRARAFVVRDDATLEIDAEELVAGDLVLLESGNRVPADLRLIDTQELDIDESLLTGESSAVAKDATLSLGAETSLADRRNMAHAGSLVARGRGRGICVGTGARTAVGQLAQDVIGARTSKPPLLVRMERFTRLIGAAIVVAAVVLAVLGIFALGLETTETVLFAVALVVAAIPEGLPIGMTVALAVATTRMARRGVIVRRLTAVEGMGSCTLIAADKTGTLTVNALTVRQLQLPDGTLFELTGSGYAPEGDVLREGAPVPATDPHRDALARIARIAALCNEGELSVEPDGSTAWRGDTVDVALLAAAHKIGVRPEDARAAWPQIDAIPYESERRFAATYHRPDPAEPRRVAVKGAHEDILAMCRISGEERARVDRQVEELAADGFRVLALADGTIQDDVPLHGADSPMPEDLQFAGLVAMRDPLRSGVEEAVHACLDAGIRVCMVTGDHRITALAIARKLGFATSADNVRTGAEIAEASPAQLAEIVGDVSVFARASPQDKLRLVEAAQRAGHFVLVTGDGVNDAPALRRSHIGVAMGKGGTDVAREAAELVIADDNFATIVSGIEEGRVAYDNIRNLIYMLISTGAAEITLVALAMAFGMPLPLLPVQLLWLNLVTQGIQDIALAFEPGDEHILERAPRPPDQRIFDRLMIERTLVAAGVMGVVGFALFYSVLPPDHTPAQLAASQNLLLLLMVLFENVHISNCRSETRSALALSPLRNPVLLLAVAGAFLAHFAAMHLEPLQVLLSTAPVDADQWLLAIGLASTIFLAMEAHKLAWRWRERRER